MYPSLWQILIILLILLLLFGHKRIREFGKSLGEGLRDFKKGLEGKTDEPTAQEKNKADFSPPPTTSQNNSNQDSSTQNNSTQNNSNQE